jgi:hypothetical protein
MEKEYLAMLLENMDSKFDLVLEGQESLRKEMHGIRDELLEKIDTNSFKIVVLNKKIDGVEDKLSKTIDGVAADLKEHRADTEAHRRVYGVRED